MGKLQRGRRRNHGKAKGPKPKPKIKPEVVSRQRSDLEKDGSQPGEDAPRRVEYGPERAGDLHKQGEDVPTHSRNAREGDEREDTRDHIGNQCGRGEDGIKVGEHGGEQGKNGKPFYDECEHVELKITREINDFDRDSVDGEPEGDDTRHRDKVFIVGTDEEATVFAPGVDPELVAMGQAQLKQVRNSLLLKPKIASLLSFP